MIITYKDCDYEFVGYHHENDTFALAGDAGYAQIIKCQPDPDDDKESFHAHFRLVPVRHTIGGIVWEETGEERVGLLKGQAGILIQSGNVVIAAHEIKVTHDTKYRILRRVEITDGQDD